VVPIRYVGGKHVQVHSVRKAIVRASSRDSFYVYEKRFWPRIGPRSIHRAQTIMAADQAGDRADRISGHPDDLLDGILVHLHCTAEAARTSVLSRRWRRVWTTLPELYFCDIHEPAEPAVRAQDRVDAALDAHAAAATVSRLELKMPYSSSHVAPERVSSWLRFASRRLAGELRLSLPCGHGDDGVKVEPEQRHVALPVCAGATAISFHHVMSHTLRFPPPPAGGTFAALATLRIRLALVNGPELEVVLSSACPRLKRLVLVEIFLRDEARGLSERSESLEKLHVIMSFMTRGRLEVVAPELQTVSLLVAWDVRIAAPKLAELNWFKFRYDPARQRFEEAGRHLRRLWVVTEPSCAAALMERFSKVDELILFVEIPKVCADALI
jgi:hypothetical protein